TRAASASPPTTSPSACPCAISWKNYAAPACRPAAPPPSAHATGRLSPTSSTGGWRGASQGTREPDDGSVAAPRPVKHRPVPTLSLPAPACSLAARHAFLAATRQNRTPFRRSSPYGPVLENHRPHLRPQGRRTRP